MEDIMIIINKQSRMVQNISKKTIGNDGENLQENLVFSFSDEFVDGTARLELTMPDDTNSYVMLTKTNETYQIPVRSLLTKTGKIYMQLVITEGTNQNDIPIFKSNRFFVKVNESINAETLAEEDYPDFIDIASAKLNEMDELMEAAEGIDLDIDKSGHITTVSITNRSGTTKSRTIRDGYDLDFDWDGTSLGVKREDEQEYEYVDLKGEKGDCNFATFEIVEGRLKMNKPENIDQIDFRLNNNGHLEMEVSI